MPLIRFDGTDAAIEIPGKGEFAGVLRAAAFDWPFFAAPATRQPVARVRQRGGRYVLSAPGEEWIETTAASAACSVLVDAVRAFIDSHPERLCFHCASVEFAGRLVVFPSRFRAGKSTLAARLAFGGRRLFGDDVLPLDDGDGQGVAMGIAPRLRVPLPETAGAEFRAFVERHACARDRRYLYLDPAGRLAPRGSTVPLGAVVLLDRRAQGPAMLFEASRAAALRSLIARNFARAAAAGDLLDRLHRVMDRLPRFTLRYSALDEAAELLERTFASWPPRAELQGAADPPTALEDHAHGAAGESAPFDRRVRLRRNPAVRLRAEDGELFLADSEGWGIHHLNALGAGLWRLLEQPVSAEEAAEVLHGAFPEAGRARVLADVERLFAALAAEGFVAAADESAGCAGAAGRP